MCMYVCVRESVSMSVCVTVADKYTPILSSYVYRTCVVCSNDVVLYLYLTN